MLDAPLVVGKVGDRDLVERTLTEHDVDTVMHFAAYTIVPESVREPLKYYGNNTCATRNLLAACMRSRRAPVRVLLDRGRVRHARRRCRATKTCALAPINPYGTSKLMSEWMLRDLAAVTPLPLRGLRYFNVAGSDPQAASGRRPRKATLLIKVACEAVVGKRTHVSIFGTDYPTPDGTGVRDYIHVEDLARAHLDALDYLRARRRLHDAQLRLRPRLQRARGARERAARRGQAARRSARSRAARATRPRWWRAPTRIRSVLGWAPQLDDLDTHRAQRPALGRAAAAQSLVDPPEKLAN